MKRIKALALGGMGGPLLFTSMVIICGALRPHYSHLNQFISELGEKNGSYSWLMNDAGLIPSGLMFIVFSLSLLCFFTRNARHFFGAMLMAMFGLGMVILGFYSCDAGCSSINVSFDGRVHGIVAAIGFISGITSMSVWAFNFRRLPQWHSLWRYSLISGLVAYALLIMIHFSAESRFFTGVWQRSCLALIFLWCVRVSRGILCSDHHSSRARINTMKEVGLEP